MPTVYHSPNCGTNRKYVFRQLKAKSLKFRVKTNANVNLCLSPSAAEVPHQQYEIFLGGWGGGESAIRRNKQDDIQKVQTPYILNKNEFKGFWIVITDHIIKVGKEGQSSPFMVHSDANVKMNVLYYGYCTSYGSAAQWTFADEIDVGHKTNNTADTGFNMNSVVDAIGQLYVQSKATAPPSATVVHHYPTAAAPAPVGHQYPTAAAPAPVGHQYPTAAAPAPVVHQYPTAPMYPPVPSYPNQSYPGGNYPPIVPQPSSCHQQIYPSASHQQASVPCAPVPSGKGLRWISCRSVSMCPEPVIGASDKQVAYVALAYHNGGLLPGVVIAPNLDICVISFDGKAIHKGDFYLLNNPGNVDLVWEKGSNGSVPVGALQGGYSEKKEPLYIGRVSQCFTNYCGKVHPSHKVCFAPRDGREISHWNYEVLCMKTVPMSLLGL